MGKHVWNWRMLNRTGRASQGQSIVELALVLPLAALCFALFLQLGALCLHQLQLQNVARETARAAVVETPTQAKAQGMSSTGLEHSRLSVDITQSGKLVRVLATYSEEVRMPALGVLLGRTTLRASAVMLQETGGQSLE